MRLRRWRVARVNAKRTNGFDSPQVRYFTRRGAVAAADQLNNLYERYEVKSGFLAAFQGTTGHHVWTAVRDRTLRSTQTHNDFIASGVYDRHPAGSFARPRGKAFNKDMTLAEYWLEGPGSELLRTFDRPVKGVDPVQPDGDVLYLQEDLNESTVLGADERSASSEPDAR